MSSIHCAPIVEAIGNQLAKQAINRIPDTYSGKICVLCSASIIDAIGVDFMDTVEAVFGPDRVSLICLWEQVSIDFAMELSAVDRQYFDGIKGEECTLVVIDDGLSPIFLTTRRIMRGLSLVRPKRILVCLPVLNSNSKYLLEKEFPDLISSVVDFVSLIEMDHNSFDVAYFNTLSGKHPEIKTFKKISAYIKKRRARKFGC